MTTWISRLSPAGGAFSRALTLAAVMGLSSGALASDTQDDLGDLPYYSAVSDALGGEQEAFTQVSTTSAFLRAAGLEQILTDKTGAPAEDARDALDALSTLDEGVASAVVGALASINEDPALATRGRFTSEAIDGVVVGERSDEWYCLTEALYFEARGESHAGQVAVAEVILNRVDSQRYPGTICGVAKQGANNGRPGCQFSFHCDGKKNHVGNKSVFERLGKLAWVMMEGKPRTLTAEALYYHNTSVKPRWARKFVKTARIGDHIFYRRPVKLSQN